MSKKLWGGRFTKKTASSIERFTHSLAVDRRLARYDLLGSLAHARMLGKTTIIPRSVASALARVLQDLLKQERKGTLRFDPKAEDIHSAIHMLIEKKAKHAAQFLHTARSRNDQVVTSLRLYCKEKLHELGQGVIGLQRVILREAQHARHLVIPGYTHLRHAQPLLVAHVLLSYVEALQRDRKRLQGTLDRCDELPLGSGALTGTSLPIDRSFVARELGFSRVSENSVDATTSRDFVAEFLAALGILSVMLSRIAEDLLLWSTSEFGFLEFGEELLTGSSMMPQKQNPDFLELTRGGAARIVGSFSGILNLLKGLPSGYQRDLQNDKELLFEAIDRMEGMLEVLTEAFQAIRWSQRNLAAQLADEALYATDCAEYLVAKGLPFGKAHQAVGQLFAAARKKGKRVSELPLSDLRRFSPLLDGGVRRLFDPFVSVRRKRSQGSTHPQQVAKAIRRWRKIL